MFQVNYWNVVCLILLLFDIETYEKAHNFYMKAKKGESLDTTDDDDEKESKIIIFFHNDVQYYIKREENLVPHGCLF